MSKKEVEISIVELSPFLFGVMCFLSGVGLVVLAVEFMKVRGII